MPAICHYKVCSTFDSASGDWQYRQGDRDRPRDLRASQSCRVIVGAPQLKRYTAFGTLFAAYQGRIFRIDRHPVMSRHPVTPMDEADLAIHLAKQTRVPIMVADLVAITSTDADARIDELAVEPSGNSRSSMSILRRHKRLQANSYSASRADPGALLPVHRGRICPLSVHGAIAASSAKAASSFRTSAASTALPSCPAAYRRRPSGKSEVQSMTASRASRSIR